MRGKDELIATDRELAALCQALATAPVISFDTEFVSEHTYRSHLCLIQVCAGERLAAIDTLAVKDLSPFWEQIVAPGREIVVHAGREEMGFCLRAMGRIPQRVFDVQVAAGLIGLEYPAGYGNLVSRVLGHSAAKGETRTDWRRRPLSDRQIHYALEDVKHLVPLRDKLAARLEQLGRFDWLDEEMSAWRTDVAESFSRQRWRKVPGSSSLPGRSLAIVRELWLWREQEAQRRDCPPRKVLRDDLIVELARRRSSDPQQVRAIRGFERRDFRTLVPDLSKAIQKALELPDKECPPIIRQDSSPQLNMLGQFLSSALSSICRDAQVAASLVGTPNDVRELVAYHLGQLESAEPPALTQGWRAKVVGRLIEDLLEGQVSISIADPLSEKPLVFEPRKVSR
jgi:ribonuclease D